MNDCEKELRDMCEHYAKEAREGELVFWPVDNMMNDHYEAYSIR